VTTPDSEPARDIGFPMPVQVQVGRLTLRALAHGTRVGRRGRQVLISQNGRFVWVQAARVRSRTELETTR
jgi:hypothetical protein